jgi:hypothetical protein
VGRILKLGCLGIVGLFAVFMVMGIIGAAIGGGDSGSGRKTAAGSEPSATVTATAAVTERATQTPAASATSQRTHEGKSTPSGSPHAHPSAHHGAHHSGHHGAPAEHGSGVIAHHWALVVVAGVAAAELPRHRLTPGVVATTSTARVCTPGYASSVRNVPDAEAEQVYARYGIPHVTYQHEVDHLVSLELGGSNSIRNLWPEPYAGRWNARVKDVLENKLHEMVCAGDLSLPHAQRQEAANWVAAYRRHVGEPPLRSQPKSKPKPAHPSAPAGFCEPGYSPCLPVTDDLNCGDLSSSQTPVTVTGDDPYGLDADGDGTGCDS